MRSLLPIRSGLFAAAITLVAGCGGGGTGTSSAADDTGCTSASTFPVAPLSSLTSDAGKLHVDIHSAPVQPLVAGLECVELIVTDPTSGASVDGLTVTMTPWMPAMGHGASVTPVVTPLGQGRYVFTNVSLFMPGEWQLRTKLTGVIAGEEGDSVDPTFSVD